jgi:hypothetical protein
MRQEGAAEFHQAMQEFGELMAFLGREGRRGWWDPATLRRVRDLIARTREELRGRSPAWWKRYRHRPHARGTARYSQG